jgi:hypothetical protein
MGNVLHLTDEWQVAQTGFTTAVWHIYPVNSKRLPALLLLITNN